MRDLSVTLVAKVVGGVILLGTQMCLAWMLGAAGRGSCAAAMLYSAGLNVVFIFGGELTAIYFVASKRFDLNAGVANAAVFTFVGSLVAIMVGWGLLQLPLTFFDKASPTAFHLALLSIPFTLASTVFTGLLTAVQRFKVFALLHVISLATTLTCTVLLVWVLDLGVEGALVAPLLGGGLTTTLALLYLRKAFGLRWVSPSFDALREMLSYGLRFYFGRLSYFINYQAGLIILAFYATREDMGIFALASQLVVQSMVVPDTLNKVLIPRAAADDEGRSALIAQSARLSGLVCGGLLLGLAVLATPVVRILFSAEFLPSVPLIRILAVGFTIRAVGRVLVPYLLGIDRPELSSLAAAAGMVVNLVLLFLLLPRIGIAAAALALSLGYVASTAIIAVAFSKNSGMRLRDTWLLQRADLVRLNGVVRGLIAKVRP